MTGLVGGPGQVRASASPAIFNSAFDALSMDWVYVGFPVSSSPEDAIRGLLDAGVRGMNVTMPHKSSAYRCADVLRPAARSIGAVNTLVLTDDGVMGDNTDARGVSRAAEVAGIAIAGRRVAVLGSGGAARACVYAVKEAGAAEVIVAARNPSAAQDLAHLADPAIFSANSLEEVGTLRPDLIINATPVGQQEELFPFTVSWLADVIDLTYHQMETPLMRQSIAAGGIAVNGLLMLVHQAAAAFELITGIAAPVDVMLAGAEGFASALKTHTGGAD